MYRGRFAPATTELFDTCRHFGGILCWFRVPVHASHIASVLVDGEVQGLSGILEWGNFDVTLLKKALANEPEV